MTRATYKDDTSSRSDTTKKAVLILASSGGGTATLGHTDPSRLLQAIDEELACINAFIQHAIYVGLCDGAGMDMADASLSQAVLYEAKRRETTTTNRTGTTPQLHEQQEPTKATSPSHQQLILLETIRDTLDNVNAYIRRNRYDDQFADLICHGSIYAIICISCCPHLFSQTLAAAARHNIPITGSGGTSLSQAASLYDIQLVGNAGGSVATTNWTRAVSYTSSLAQHWKRPYSLAISKAQNRGQPTSPSPTTTSVLTSCLGVVWVVCLMTNLVIPYGLLAVSKFLSYDATGNVQSLLYMLQHWCIPITCSVIMATSTRRSKETAGAGGEASSSPGLIMAAIVAAASSPQSILGSLLAGKLVAVLSEQCAFACVTRNVPATMTNLVTSGGLGGMVALLLLPLTPLFRSITSWTRLAIGYTITRDDFRLNMASAALWGILSCYGSKVGWYHAIHLPLILVEMEHGDASFLGAVDELTLVLVCAGVCAGKLLLTCSHTLAHGQVSDADAALSWRGWRINLLYGDFVEACYPFLEKSLFVTMACYLASGLSCAVLFLPSSSDDGYSAVATTSTKIPSSMAYLPWPVAVLLTGDEWYRFVLASLVAFGIPLTATVASHAGSVVAPKVRMKRDSQEMRKET